MLKNWIELPILFCTPQCFWGVQNNIGTSYITLRFGVTVITTYIVRSVSYCEPYQTEIHRIRIDTGLVQYKNQQFWKCDRSSTLCFCGKITINPDFNSLTLKNNVIHLQKKFTTVSIRVSLHYSFARFKISAFPYAMNNEDGGRLKLQSIPPTSSSHYDSMNELETFCLQGNWIISDAVKAASISQWDIVHIMGKDDKCAPMSRSIVQSPCYVQHSNHATSFLR